MSHDQREIHSPTPSKVPYIVAIGGTLREGSSTERALAIALAAAQAAGARTCLLGASVLNIPMYAPHDRERHPAAQRLVAEIRQADGLIIGSPGYHGGVSGLVKNALDYVEDLRDDPAPYFHSRPVGLLATGAGWQGAVNTLSALRGIVHALRGWPTPLGVAINTVEPFQDAATGNVMPRIRDQLEMLARQVVEFAVRQGQSPTKSV